MPTKRRVALTVYYKNGNIHSMQHQNDKQKHVFFWTQGSEQPC